ncbi:MAG: hypothetical protein HFE66_02860 [Clostridiales bacterium]|jgi:hypothetical protein|nr:hypothetical protein [Clostridiales bacterium]
MVQNDGRTGSRPRTFGTNRFFHVPGGIGIKIRNFISRRFDESMILHGADQFRQIFFRLRLRFVGTFLLTFGAYASIITVLVSLFQHEQISGAHLYSGLCAMILSIPLLLSKGNISTALLGSRIGNTLCDYFSVRRESLQEYIFVGHANIAFVLGVIAGTLTFWISPVYVLFGLMAAVGIGIIFSLPENGILFASVLLLFTGEKMQLWILSITIASYILKLIRGKRSLIFYKRDLFAILMLLTLLGGVLVNSMGTLLPQTGTYVLYMCVYFLSTFILYDFRKINRITTALCVAGGVLGAMYLTGVALDTYFAGSIFRDAGFLLHFVLALPVFQQGVAPILFMTLFVLSMGICLRSSLYIPRGTAIFCTLIMLAALVLCSSGVEVLCAFVAVVFLILLYRKRSGFFLLGFLLAAFVLIIHMTGSFGDMVYRYFANSCMEIVRGVQELFSGLAGLDKTQLFVGEGLGTVLQGMPSMQKVTGSSYLSFIQALGLIGLLIFFVFVIILFGTSLQFYKKTFGRGRAFEASLRFGVIRIPSDMRLGGGTPLCAVAALLLCGTALPVWQNGIAFELFWLLCGIGAAYVKSAAREIEKADQAILSDSGAENASVTLRRKKED